MKKRAVAAAVLCRCAATVLLVAAAAVKAAEAACDVGAQRESLVAFYNQTGGSATSLAFTLELLEQEACTGGPPHCCWRGVQCCRAASSAPSCDPGTVTSLQLRKCNLTGPLEAALDALSPGLACSLTELQLGVNGLTGTIPPSVTLLRNLNIVGLASNELQGTIPEDLSRLPALQELDVTSNSLSGKVPSSLCGDSRHPCSLVNLLLGSNLFSGEFDVPHCTSLRRLELQNNTFSGPFPDMGQYPYLEHATLGINRFNTSLPTTPVGTRWLARLDSSFHNSVAPSGILSEELLHGWPVLHTLRLRQQNLIGTIPPALFELPTLSHVCLEDNNLTGTIPESIGSAYVMTFLSLRGNALSGALPESIISIASQFTVVDLSDNNLLCCVNTTTGELNLSMPRLPHALHLSTDQFEPPPKRSRGANLQGMICPQLLLYELDPYTFRFTNTTVSSNWVLDPLYYLFQGCRCIEGYYLNDSNILDVHCEYIVAVHHSDVFSMHAWVVPLIVVPGMVLLCCVLWVLLRSHAPPFFVQYVMDMRKRLLGEPVGPRKVAVVVTDIEGYSSLMKVAPDLMCHAVAQHNAAIRAAKWDNYGFIVEQEGDSYALAFYEPLDASRFALQVQQRLLTEDWNEELLTLTDPQQQQEQSLKEGSATTPRALRSAGASALSLTWLAKAFNSNSPSTMFSPERPQWLPQRALSSKSLAAALGQSNTAAAAPDLHAHLQAHHLGTPTASSVSAGPAAEGIANVTLATASRSIGHQRPSVFRGLRVRMGVSYGHLPPLATAAGSAVLERAKLVCNAAQGGQVLMDDSVFLQIRERTAELGLVGHGKPLRGLRGRQRWCQRRRKGWWGDVMACFSTVQHGPSDAVLLCMGEHRLFPSGRAPGVIQGAPTGSQVQLSSDDSCGSLELDSATRLSAQPQQQQHQHQQQDGSTATVVPGGAEPLTHSVMLALSSQEMQVFSAAGKEALRLYQMCSPALAARAKVFGTQLQLKEDWVMYERPYFDAPCTPEAPLGLEPRKSAMLPGVTAAFCSVEGGKQLAAHSRSMARAVHESCLSCIHNTLRQVPGYLCRDQPGELRYMLVFRSPVDAVRWALLLQEVLVRVAWPDQLLRQSAFREEHDAQGRMVFVGARMKVGLCHGHPEMVHPDHMGRADYHGASINQAARCSEAAAHGGQVVCDMELALQVLAALRAEGADRFRPGMAASELAPAAAGAAGGGRGAGCSPGSRGTPRSPRHRPLLAGDADLGGECGGGLCSSEEEGKGGGDGSEGPAEEIAVASLANRDVPARLGSSARQLPSLRLEKSQHQRRSASPAASRAYRRLSQLALAPAPVGLAHRHVVCHRIGRYLFKGSSETVAMASIATEPLSGRSYPTAAPCGKGMRVELESELIGKAEVLLPDLMTNYEDLRQLHLQQQQQQQAQQAQQQQQQSRALTLAQNLYKARFSDSPSSGEHHHTSDPRNMLQQLAHPHWDGGSGLLRSSILRRVMSNGHAPPGPARSSLAEPQEARPETLG